MTDMYKLINDKGRIKKIQDASLDSKSPYGFKTENGILFGSTEWLKPLKKEKSLLLIL
jgi:hypothetical protein